MRLPRSGVVARMGDVGVAAEGKDPGDDSHQFCRRADIERRRGLTVVLVGGVSFCLRLENQ